MSTIPTITEQNIRALVGEASFLRGQSYFRNGNIFDTRRQGMTLKGRCQGSLPQAYRVQVTFNDQITFDDNTIIDASCSCPLGGYCKHVAALLLTWLDSPEEFIEQQEVETSLEQCTKAELIALIKKMLRRQPEMEILLPTVSTHHATVDPRIYHRQVSAAFRNAGYEWGAVAELADELLSVKDIGDDFVQQQDYASAVVAYEALATGVIEHYNSYDDEAGELGSILNECVDELKECLANVQDDRNLREKIMQVLFAIYKFDVESGGIGIGEDVPDILVEDTTAEERQAIVGWVRDALSASGDRQWSSQIYGGFLLDLEADTLDDETFLRICRETGRTGDAVDRLLTLGRVDEAIREAEQAGDYYLMALADIFVQHGHAGIAEHMIEERSKTSQDTRLLDWLKNRCLARDDKAAALQLAEKLFYKQFVTLAHYQEIRQIAQQVGRWEDLHPTLLDYLREKQNNYLLIQIALDEGDIDKALELVKTEQRQGQAYSYSYGYGYSTIALEVARAAEETRPRESIEIYRKHVERLIDRRGRGSYQQACQYLLRIRDLYEKLGEHETWINYITTLRDKNRSLRALKEELANAGL
jgi:uncharacterized Zn finger protein